MVVESRSNLQQTSFLIKTAVFSRHRNVKLRQTSIHLVYFHAFKLCLNFRFVGETILLKNILGEFKLLFSFIFVLTSTTSPLQFTRGFLITISKTSISCLRKVLPAT